MEASTEDIRRELDAKRDALTRDVEKLEAKVKTTFDLRHQISERPLLSVSMAIIGGFVLGRLGSGAPVAGQSVTTMAHGTRTAGGAVTPYGSAYGVVGQSGPGVPGGGSSTSALLDQVKAGLKDSVHQGAQGGADVVLTNITAALTALLVDKAKDLLDQNLPGFAHQYDQLADHHSTAAPGAGRRPYDYSTTTAPTFPGARSSSEAPPVGSGVTSFDRSDAPATTT